MIRHYLKIACRNLLKYKTQSIISILKAVHHHILIIKGVLGVNFDNLNEAHDTHVLQVLTLRAQETRNC